MNEVKRYESVSMNDISPDTINDEDGSHEPQYIFFKTLDNYVGRAISWIVKKPQYSIPLFLGLLAGGAGVISVLTTALIRRDITPAPSTYIPGFNGTAASGYSPYKNTTSAPSTYRTGLDLDLDDDGNTKKPADDSTVSVCALGTWSVRADSLILRHQDIFTGGPSKPEGYRQIRLPSIVVADGDADGHNVVMVFAEGREKSRNDPGRSNSIDIVYKRSVDGGQTWGGLTVLADGSDHYPGNAAANTAYQPTTVMDTQGDYQRMYVFYNRAQLRPFYRYSDDLGQTWSAQVDLRANMKNRPENIRKFSVNLASGIQMQDGKLVVPMNVILKDDPAGQNRPAVAYSDDHGETWKYGGHAPAGANEHQVTEVFRDDASLLYSASRKDGREVNTRRTNIGTFNDTSDQWSFGRNGIPVDGHGNDIKSFPISTAVERYTNNSLLMTLPQGRSSSGQLTNTNICVFVSTDEGLSYNLPQILFRGKAGYSDMAAINGDVFLIAWERGKSENAEFITLTTANQKFLDSNHLGNSTVTAGEIAYDGFEYDPSDSLDSQSGGEGFNTQWCTAGDSPVAISQSSLHVNFGQQGVMHAFPTKGNKVQITEGHQSATRGMGVPIDLGKDQDYYFSTLLKKETTIGDGQNEWLSFVLLDSDGSEHINSNLSGDRSFTGKWVTTGSQETVSFDLQTGETCLLVAKVEARASGNDVLRFSIFRDGDDLPHIDTDLNWLLSVENSVAPDAVQNGAILVSLQVSGVNAIWSIDEVRLSKDWCSVTGQYPVPVI